MGKEINTFKNVSTGIRHNDIIYFLCQYTLQEPGRYFFVIFIPGKLHHDSLHLYSLNLKTGKLNKIHQVKSDYDNPGFKRYTTRWHRDGESIFFLYNPGWDRGKKESINLIFRYNTETGSLENFDRVESDRLYSKFFKDKKAISKNDRADITDILYYTGILPEDVWRLPSPVDYSGMSRNNLKKAIVELRGDREFREAAFRKIRDSLSSNEIFEMISAMEKLHSKKNGAEKITGNLIAAEWSSRLYIEAEFGKKPYTREENNSIHRAVYRKDREALTRLISEGLNPDTRDSAGLTPLMIAAFVNDPVILEILLSNGADINAVDSKGCTPLVYSVFGRSHLTMKTLLSKGAARSIKGESLSHAWLYAALSPLRQWYLKHEKSEREK